MNPNQFKRHLNTRYNLFAMNDNGVVIVGDGHDPVLVGLDNDPAWFLVCQGDRRVSVPVSRPEEAARIAVNMATTRQSQADILVNGWRKLAPVVAVALVLLAALPLALV